MKKILIVLFIFPILVKAETFYSDYTLTNSINNLDKDLVKIETIKKYNTFDYIKKDMGYLNDTNRYIKDENDYIEEIVENTNYDESKEQKLVIHTLDNKTNYLYLSFKYQHYYLKIYEVEVYVNNEKVNYTTKRTDVSNIMDNNYDTFYIPSLWYKSIGLYLDKVYDLKDIKLIIYASSIQDEEICIATAYGYSIKLDKNNTKKYNIYFKEDNHKAVDYYYLSKEKLYKYYYIDKNILNKYVEYKPNTNILLDDYIEEKKYYKRDKLVLKDNIVFTNKDDVIENFIEYITDNVSYICNINKSINGNYLCEFKIGNKIYLKRIVVNIDKDNDINNVNNNTISESENNKENSIILENVENKDNNKYMKKTSNYKTYNNTVKENKDDKNIKKQNLNNKVNKNINNNIKLNNKHNILKILIVLFLIIINIFLIKKSKVMSKDFKNKNK